MLFDKNEKDDFWDVEKLLPKKKSTLTPFSTKEKTVDYNVPGEKAEKKGTTVLSYKNEKETSSDSVSYKIDGGLIRSVTIKKFIDKYDFYGNFRKAAMVYYEFKTPKCDFAPFFSYMPQYSQFNSQQKSFYFYWRDCVRRGKYIKTDYSYLYLYVYEIINLPDLVKPEEGLKLLCKLWRAYRNDLPAIDANMSLWVQDYCLIYNLPCPMNEIGDFIFDVIGAAEFKEFYLADISTLASNGVCALIAYLSDYDWRRGKYAGGESREIYAKHLTGAMRLLIEELWRSGVILSENTESTVISRSAFRNSLCTHSVKCKLEIEYIPLSKAEGLRAAFTSALRYTENKLRALLGVKSRLAVKDLPSEYRGVIDAYFADIFEKAEKERQKAAMPEYERLYDADSDEMSFEGADEIERASWTTTARLVEDEEPEAEEIITAPEITENEAFENSDDSFGLSKAEILFVKAVYEDNKDEIKNTSEQLGVLPEAISDKVNETFADNFGDVIIEASEDGFTIIEDYLEDVKEWLLKLTK